MKVIVIGAGIGGLAAAHGLEREGADVLVVERGTSGGPQGSGLTLFGNGLNALSALGLGEQLADLTSGGLAPTGGGQRDPSGAWLSRVSSSVVSTTRVVHRAELHAALAASLPRGTVEFGASAQVLDPDSGVVRIGGREESADLVVCADGLRSQSRTALGLDTGTRWAGYGAWRGVTPGPVDGVEPSETWGRGHRFGLVPLPDGRVYWFAVRDGDRDSMGSHRDEVLDMFRDWHDPIREVVSSTPPDGISWSPVEELARPLSAYGRGRCLLLGDAAHAMTPNLGQGGNQALEDAAVLARLLRSLSLSSPTSQHELAPLLACYDDLRRPRTQRIAAMSRRVGMVAQTRGAVRARLRDAAVRATPGSVVSRFTTQLASWQPPE